MELRQLRYFVVLADLLHFGDAAAELHISQPGLSQQIRRLEDDLGVVLFERGRNTRLTPAGAVLAELAAPLLDHAGRVRTQVVRAASSEVAGTLRIVLTRSAPTPLIHDFLEPFRAQHPEIDVQIETAWTALNVSMLRLGTADAAFVQLPLDETDGLEVVELSRVDLAIILPSDHPLAQQDVVTLDEIRGVPCVGWPREHAPGAWDQLIAAVWGDTEPRFVRLEPDLERMMAAVRNGHGFALATHERAQQLRRDGVVVRQFAEPAPSYLFGLCWLSDNPNPALRALRADVEAFRP